MHRRNRRACMHTARTYNPAGACLCAHSVLATAGGFGNPAHALQQGVAAPVLAPLMLFTPATATHCTLQVVGKCQQGSQDVLEGSCGTCPKYNS
jgi:hypothetical protein